jgi:2'-5' RNA ligase
MSLKIGSARVDHPRAAGLTERQRAMQNVGEAKKYVLHCLLSGPVIEYQNGLIGEIADRFGLGFTREQSLPPHFTLKYEFEAVEMSAVEEHLDRYCRQHRKAPVQVGGFGEFRPDVLFLNVHLSPAAKELFHQLLGELRGVPWITWSPYDGEALHFHATVAERCGSRLDEVRGYLRGREQSFACWFDNVTLMVQSGVVDDISRWRVHRRFPLE